MPYIEVWTEEDLETELKRQNPESELILRRYGEGLSEGESVPEELVPGMEYLFKADGLHNYVIGEAIPLKTRSIEGEIISLGNVTILSRRNSMGRTCGRFRAEYEHNS